MVNENPQTEFDSPWKQILQLYFEDFMLFFFPQAHEQIDWTRQPEFLDQELEQVVRDAELGKHLADKLVKIYLKDGSETWVLIHVEIQSQEESNFGRRMYTYNYRIYDRYWTLDKKNVRVIFTRTRKMINLVYTFSHLLSNLLTILVNNTRRWSHIKNYNI